MDLNQMIANQFIDKRESLESEILELKSLIVEMKFSYEELQKSHDCLERVLDKKEI